MSDYFYAENDQQLGPFTINELKIKRLKKSTLVWTDGMQDWKNAGEIQELKDILISEPPPLPEKVMASPIADTIIIKQSPIRVTSSDFDLKYERETEATFVGIILLVVPILLKETGLVTFETEISYGQAKWVLSIVSIVIRIAVTFWVVNIATRQNRNSTGWAWFAFLLPSIALIVIGQLKKLRLIIKLDSSLPSNQQLEVLLHKADQLFSANRFEECILILNKAIDIEGHNFDSIKLRALANYQTQKYDKAKLDFETLIGNGQFLSLSNYYLGNIASFNKNRELAVSFWLKANQLKNESAKEKLDRYHTFIGKYLLEFSQIMRKVRSYENEASIHFLYVKYQGGLPQIDHLETPGSLKTSIYCYDLGLHIELKKSFKTYHLGISFYEIADILFWDTEKKFELYLVDNNILLFNYDLSKDYNKSIKDLCIKYTQATNKTPSALAALKD